MPALEYGSVQANVAQADLTVVARYLLPLMLRNIASDGFVFSDPADPRRFSVPGCILASPSYPLDLTTVDQNYVYNWTRDSAVTAIEIANAQLPVAGVGSGPLIDYVIFARLCQSNAPTLAKASYTIEGQWRENWVEQNDGPALQTIAVLAAYPQLDTATQAIAEAVIAANAAFVLAYYQNANFNLWEETFGQSFFTRAVQLQALTDLQANTLGIPVPAGVDVAVAWLIQRLQDHWNGEYYVSILEPVSPRAGYDPNIDIVLAANYGAVLPTDGKLLATAALVRRQWADPASPNTYPINASDAALGFGPMVGRYPGDKYDGDGDSGNDTTDHPWALCTAGFAQLYYQVAASILESGAVPYDALSATFLGQIGIDSATASADAVAKLRNAGDAMLQALIRHSDHLELSEQFDGTTGYEKSVRNLTWSYAAFLSAVRARTASTT